MLAAAGLALALVLGGAPGLVESTPTATLRSERQLPEFYQQGIARVPGGWILAGTTALARVDERLRTKQRVGIVIPSRLRVEGYNHIGDIDVVGPTIYAPLEQADYELGEQVTARFDAKTLAFRDSVTLAQHENSFVTVDPRTMTAYSLDHFGGDALLRYDVRANWKPLAPLALSRFIDKVQGGDVSGGFIWLSTSDPTNELFRVDLATGAVDDLGSAGHVGGEGEGIDATRLRSGRLHALTIDVAKSPVWLGDFAVSG